MRMKHTNTISRLQKRLCTLKFTHKNLFENRVQCNLIHYFLSYDILHSLIMIPIFAVACHNVATLNLKSLMGLK